MRGPKFILLSLCATVCAVLASAAPSQAQTAKDNEKSCSPNSLPPALQKKLADQFGAWRIQGPNDLSAAATARWSAGFYSGCPGLVAGEFRESQRMSYALLLVPVEKPDSGYRLVIYTQAGTKSAEEFDVLAKQDGPGASNFFVIADKTADLFDEATRRNSHITAKEAVVAFEAGENQYEVDAYYWADGAYRSVPEDM